MKNIKLEVDRKGDLIFTFGKYKGETLDRVYKLDPEYITWLIKETDNSDIKWFLKVKECELKDDFNKSL